MQHEVRFVRGRFSPLPGCLGRASVLGIMPDWNPAEMIGASAGLALHPQHGETADALFASADIALYAAKEAGRDRIHEPAAAQH